MVTTMIMSIIAAVFAGILIILSGMFTASAGFHHLHNFVSISYTSQLKTI